MKIWVKNRGQRSWVRIFVRIRLIEGSNKFISYKDQSDYMIKLTLNFDKNL